MPDQMIRDRELTEEEVQWMHDQNDKMGRELERLAAEVAAGEKAARPGDDDLGDILAGSIADQTGQENPPAAGKATVRFGQRLRDALAPDEQTDVDLNLEDWQRAALRIADAVDQDAAVLRLRAFSVNWQRDAELIRLAKQMHGADLRLRVEEAMKRLSFELPSWRGDGEADVTVVEAGPLLAELAEIFGAPEGT